MTEILKLTAGENARTGHSIKKTMRPPFNPGTSRPRFRPIRIDVDVLAGVSEKKKMCATGVILSLSLLFAIILFFLAVLLFVSRLARIDRSPEGKFCNMTPYDYRNNTPNVASTTNSKAKF